MESHNLLVLTNIKKYLKDIGYYFSEIEISVEELKDNKINIEYDITLGQKAKIKKISFIGDKIFKDRKLKGVQKVSFSSLFIL